MLAAILRTVSVLPQLHPWRLGDDKGTSRILQWSAAAGDVTPEVFGVLTMTQREPSLDMSDEDSFADLTWGVASDTWKAPDAPPPRWGGVVGQLTGAWVPPLAILPSSHAEWDDPRGRWSTESVDFDAAHRVYTDDTHYAANVLAPHVMAIISDDIPTGSAVTIAGDAVHIWWPHTHPFAEEPGRVGIAAKALAVLVAALPSFVLHDYPDHSDVLQDELAQRAAAAAQYREQRTPGHSSDPVLDRIYQVARHNAGLDS